VGIFDGFGKKREEKPRADFSTLLFYSMKRGDGGGMWISFRTPGGSWSRQVARSPLFGDIRVYARLL